MLDNAPHEDAHSPRAWGLAWGLLGLACWIARCLCVMNLPRWCPSLFDSDSCASCFPSAQHSATITTTSIYLNDFGTASTDFGILDRDLPLLQSAR